MRNKSPLANQMRMNRMREVRDLYNHLRKTWKTDLVYLFFQRQYFLAPATVDHFVYAASDREPVEAPSTIYQTAMKDGFDIRLFI